MVEDAAILPTVSELSISNQQVLAKRARVRRMYRKIAAVSGVILVGGVPLCLGAPLVWGALLGTLGLVLGRLFWGPLVPVFFNDRLPWLAKGLINFALYGGLVGWTQTIFGISITGSNFVWLLGCLLSFPLFDGKRRRG